MAIHLGNKGFTCVMKPWGEEVIWTNTDKYIGKLLIINEGEELSLQYHEQKTETMLILDGKVEVEFSPKDNPSTAKHILGKGDTIHIEPGTIHRLRAVETDEGFNDVLIVEISTNFPKDIIRLEDKYGRK